jgi:hypothetical protein
MATANAETNGDIMSTALDANMPRQTNKGRFVLWNYNPSSVNQGYSPFYKMQGYDSIAGWQSWVNSSGGEDGRPAAVGVQSPGTVVATWFVLFGGS